MGSEGPTGGPGDPAVPVERGSFLDMVRREARHASLYTLTTFLTQFGSFLVVPLFWQKLSLEDYGVIGLTEMIGTFLTLFLGLSLDTAITRFYYEWPEDQRRRRVGTLWLLNWAACLVTGTVATALLWRVSALLFPDVAFYPYIFLGLILTVLRCLFVLPYATIRIVNSPGLYAFYTIGGFVIQMTLNIVYVLVLDRKLHGYFVSSIIGTAITAAMGGLIMLRFATPCFERQGLRESLRFSLPAIPTSLLSAVTQVLDRFLLQRFGSIEALGVYAVSQKFTNLIVYLHNALKLSYVPFMVKSVAADPAEGVRLLVRIRRLYVVPLFIAGLAIAVFITDFVAVAGRREYFQIAAWVPWLVGPALIATLTVYFAPGLFLAKRTDLTWIPQVVQLAAVALTGILLIPALQLTGVVVSRYLSTISLFAATLVLSQRVYPIATEWRRLAEMAVVVVGSIVLASAVDLGSLLLNVPIRLVIMAGAVVALGYVVTRSLSTLRTGVRSILLSRPATIKAFR